MNTIREVKNPCCRGDDTISYLLKYFVVYNWFKNFRRYSLEGYKSTIFYLVTIFVFGDWWKISIETSFLHFFYFSPFPPLFHPSPVNDCNAFCITVFMQICSSYAHDSASIAWWILHFTDRWSLQFCMYFAEKWVKSPLLPVMLLNL